MVKPIAAHAHESHFAIRVHDGCPLAAHGGDLGTLPGGEVGCGESTSAYPVDTVFTHEFNHLGILCLAPVCVYLGHFRWYVAQRWVPSSPLNVFTAHVLR